MNIWYILLFNIILSLILNYSKDKRKIKIIRVIQITIFIIIAYFVTDTFIDFLIIMCCCSVIYILFVVMDSEWIKPKLFFRFILSSICGIVMTFILYNINKFVLGNPFVLWLMLVFIIPYNNRSKKWNKLMYIETGIFLISAFICIYLIQNVYLVEEYNKPQRYAVDYIVDKAHVPREDIERVYNTKGIRGEEVEITIKTKDESYRVIYKGNKIIDIIQ